MLLKKTVRKTIQECVYVLFSSVLVKACVTNSTAAGRFLVAGGFTGLPLIFPHRTDAVQKCATYVAVLGADRPPLWCSPAWELQIVQRQLCTSTVISDARTASAFLNGHRPRCLDARSSYDICSSTVTARHHFRPPDSSKQLRVKKLADIVNFLKSLEFLRNIMFQMMQLKMHGF
jgi:hypothetical protein